jgi:hypothetical protein
MPQGVQASLPWFANDRTLHVLIAPGRKINRFTKLAICFDCLIVRNPPRWMNDYRVYD